MPVVEFVTRKDYQGLNWLYLKIVYKNQHEYLQKQ